MEVRVLDHYGSDPEPKTFTGTPMEIEYQLRDYFKGVVGHIPFGDLHEMVTSLQRMTGMDIWVSEQPAKTMRRKRPMRTSSPDPWLHELDLPDESGNDNL